MLEILTQYQTQILALLGVFVVLLLLIIIKKRARKPHIIDDPYDNDNISEESATQDQQTRTIIPPQESTQDQDVAYSQEEDETLEEQHLSSTEEYEGLRKHSKAQKRDVPAHEKIKKEHFKEFTTHRVLLAEDNLINQKVILGLLADSPIEIVVANDGQEALDILEKDQNFSLILMDAHMPNIDGFEATKKIRANSKYDYIPVIALSGDTARDDILKMENAGMEAHLEKPLKLDALYDILYMYAPDTLPSATQNTQEKVQQQTQEFETHTNALEVLNTKKGLEVCGEDEGFYAEILKEFIKDYRNSSKQLQKFINEKLNEDADKLLLDLSGVAANIGADDLHQKAQNLKRAITQNEDIKTNFLAYHQSLKELLLAIQEYLQR